jgi:C-lobe and N-lobe beta barrels of Tf-binding protein B
MSRKSRSTAHCFGSSSYLVPSLCLLLSACGGDGAFVATIPSPPATPSATPTPTPTPTPSLSEGAYPLTRAGTYDLMGTFELHPSEPGPMNNGVAAPGAFSMTVSKPAGQQGFSYKLDAPSGFLPGDLKSIDYGPSSSTGVNLVTGRGGYSRVQPFNADKNLASFLSYDAGFSYVSMGEWEWYFVHLDGGTAGGFGQLFFVNGDRTAGADIPASGTATYNAHTLASLSTNLTAGIPFILTADFGQRTILTKIDQDYRYNPNGDLLDYPAPGIHVGGIAPFSNSGTFEILLTGTVNYTGGYPLNTPETPPTQQVTGDMNGAFFGPHAEQVGGVFSLQNSAGVQLLQDAFVGQQHHP